VPVRGVFLIMNRFLCVAASLAAAALSLGVAGTASASAPASKVVEVCRSAPTGSVDRGKVMVKPSWVSLACDSDYVYLERLHWTSWSPAQARSAGLEAQDTCVPSCLAGHFRTFPVLVTLSGSMKVAGRVGYAQLAVTFTGARPSGLPKTVIYKLPLPA
jgi:hypothetical protein